MPAGPRRRLAALTASLLAGAALLGSAGPVRATEATSSVSVTDPGNDIRDGVTEDPVSGPPEIDITSTTASYANGRITLTMVTGGPDDLGAGSFVSWGLFTTSIDADLPDFQVFATPTDNGWSVFVGRDFLGEDICPAGAFRSAVYDAAATSYTVSFDASCIGAPGSFRFQASRIDMGTGENGVYDSAPDGDTLSDPVVGGPAHGYWMVGVDGKVYAFGDAKKWGELAGPIPSPVVDIEPTPGGDGYWIVDDRGFVSAFGAATSLGNADQSTLASGEKVTSLSATPSGGGYWIFTTKGRVLPFGDAQYFGDLSGLILNGPVQDSIPTPSGHGYYMVASDGGVFSFGDARFYGSTGNIRLNKPVQSLVPHPSGQGYWLVASDGGVFAFGASPFLGSMGAVRLNKPVTGMVAFGNGYLMVAEDGGIFNFSDRPFDGSLGANPPANPVVSVAALPV
ncbi:MAG TPA: hypothetical protein VG034_05885 [Acidimicrobiia bacterium]|nr:hypothetical protein [Acidimicrobiia bacterium]